jgi:hypothetical protein
MALGSSIADVISARLKTHSVTASPIRLIIGSS